jgi:hypothetical protein
MASMLAFGYLVFTLALMVLLMRRRVDVGCALLVGAATVGVLFGTDWGQWPRGFGRSLVDVFSTLARAAVQPTGLELLGLVLMITFLGHVLRHAESLGRLLGALRRLLRDRRAAMAVAPAFVGLLPMPGGAAFSAPMVGELTDDLAVPQEDRTVINFWFRHVWEWAWPLYPAVLFSAKILGAPLDRLVVAQLPCTVAAILIGVFLCFRRVKLPAADAERASAAGSWRELLLAAWPVFVVIGATLVFAVAKRLGDRLGLPTETGVLALSTEAALLIILVVVNPLFLALNRVSVRDTLRLVRQTVTLRLVVLVVGVVAFEYMLRRYEAVKALPATFQAMGVPPLVLLFVVPFVVGVLLGYQPAVVAACLPVMLPLLVEDGRIHYGDALWSFAGGFLGVLISPVHLCLVLSREYFAAEVERVYRRLLPPTALLAVAALAVRFLWEAVGLR